MAEKIIYLKMTKPWGGFNVGDVVRFGENKGRGRIEKGEGIEVAKQKAVNAVSYTHLTLPTSDLV